MEVGTPIPISTASGSALPNRAPAPSLISRKASMPTMYDLGPKPATVVRRPPPTDVRGPTREKYAGWLMWARRGDRALYYQGHLAGSRHWSKSIYKDAADGLVDLVQARNGTRFDYIAIRTGKRRRL